MTIEDIKGKGKKKLNASGIFIEIGMVPNSKPVKHLIKLNRLGEIPVNCSCETEIAGLYAAGDVTSVPEKQIVIAAGEGAKAALQAHRFLQRLIM
jgi:alkyl hydroperoxide reductase subunit F